MKFAEQLRSIETQGKKEKAAVIGETGPIYRMTGVLGRGATERAQTLNSDEPREPSRERKAMGEACNRTWSRSSKKKFRMFIKLGYFRAPGVSKKH